MRTDASRLKKQAAHEAVKFVKSGMTVGLGHGSTAYFAVLRLAELIRLGKLKKIRGVPCSWKVHEEARKLGIPLTTLNRNPVVDITIDGADEVDNRLNLIKGGGGALFKEKIVAQASLREIIVVDESKMSPMIGTQRAVPVEVAPFGWQAHIPFLETLGSKVKVRKKTDVTLFKTEGGNIILDANFGPVMNPAQLAATLDGRAGILEHGLFIGLATDVIIAGKDGLRHLTRE